MRPVPICWLRNTAATYTERPDSRIKSGRPPGRRERRQPRQNYHKGQGIALYWPDLNTALARRMEREGHLFHLTPGAVDRNE